MIKKYKSQGETEPRQMEKLQNGILFRMNVAEVTFQAEKKHMYEYDEIWLSKNTPPSEINKILGKKAPAGLIGFLRGNRPPDPDWGMDIKQIWLENIGWMKRELKNREEAEINSMIMSKHIVDREWKEDGNYKHKKIRRGAINARI